RKTPLDDDAQESLPTCSNAEERRRKGLMESAAARPSLRRHRHNFMGRFVLVIRYRRNERLGPFESSE
ncbi:MAG: hypothetical protein Q9217_005625, partial [Psora testacea]